MGERAYQKRSAKTHFPVAVAPEVTHRKNLEMVILRNCHRFNGGSRFRRCCPVKTSPLKTSLDSHNENHRMSFWGH